VIKSFVIHPHLNPLTSRERKLQLGLIQLISWNNLFSPSMGEKMKEGVDPKPFTFILPSPLSTLTLRQAGINGEEISNHNPK
tara:strand:- start:2477 stop:2722 length:246 start_codon:yes stop_codon:yes gene_type:complete